MFKIKQLQKVKVPAIFEKNQNNQQICNCSNINGNYLDNTTLKSQSYQKKSKHVDPKQTQGSLKYNLNKDCSQNNTDQEQSSIKNESGEKQKRECLEKCTQQIIDIKEVHSNDLNYQEKRFQDKILIRVNNHANECKQELPNQIINFFKENQYQLGNFIAAGGFGVVFDGKIYQNNKLQEVIFKIQFSNDKNKSEKEEFLIMKGFEKNINLIQVIDYKAIDENCSIFIMERCECSLKDRLQQFQQQKQFSFRQLLQIIFDLLDGLILLRMYKIIHLDIKPQNILVNYYGIYVISDFGTFIKNIQNEKDLQIKIKGYTKYYAPQEVIKNDRISYQSDVFSFGKTLSFIIQEYEKLSNSNLSEKLQDLSDNDKQQIKQFKQILEKYVLKEQSSERKEALELHKYFYEAVQFEQNQEFLLSYADKIRLILSQNKHDHHKNVQFFNEVSIYYNEKIIELKQKIKKYNILNVIEIEQLPNIPLEEVDKISRKEDSEYILIYNSIADYYNEQSQFGKARAQLVKSLDLCNELFKKEHLYTASTLNKLGLFNLYEVGLDYSLQLIQMIVKIIKGDSDYKAIYLNTLSWCFSKLQNNYQALEMQQESLKVRENIFTEYHTRIAIGYNNLGTMYQKFDLDKCLGYQLKSLKIRRHIFEENHPCTARSLDCVGQVYLKKGNLRQAKKYLFNSYFMRKKIYQGDIDCIAVSLFNIAKYHQKAGQFINAIIFYQKYFQMILNLKYEIRNVYICVYNIAKCYFSRRQFQQSIDIFQTFLKIFSQNSAKISKTNIIIGLCQFNMGKYQQGLEFIYKSISIDKNVIQQDIHKLCYLIRNIFQRYKFFRYISICLNLNGQSINYLKNLQFKKYQQFLRLIYLLILEFQELDQDQKFKLYDNILKINKK